MTISPEGEVRGNDILHSLQGKEKKKKKKRLSDVYTKVFIYVERERVDNICMYIRIYVYI